MKIFIVLTKDRHTDTTAKPFFKIYEAIDHARKVAKENCSLPDGPEEREINGWVFFSEYSCEGDCVWITEHEI